ncbi:hypothetical protein EDD38_2989 [Kitasatospora cineracea]|uniref:Uncharacterized protein n=1 Tax=Kitasatospora cineracea TaxID=88074 RepID=A0A3N4RMN0_9ACTN|nr:hypothetical protein EDD38_2989 [Kitasatospora cineracea]
MHLAIAKGGGKFRELAESGRYAPNPDHDPKRPRPRRGTPGPARRIAGPAPPPCRTARTGQDPGAGLVAAWRRPSMNRVWAGCEPGAGRVRAEYEPGAGRARTGSGPGAGRVRTGCGPGAIETTTAVHRPRAGAMTVGSRCVGALLRTSRVVGQAPGNPPRGGARRSASFPHTREPDRTRAPSLGGARSEPYSERHRSPTVVVVRGRIATAAVPATGTGRSAVASPCVGPFQLKSFEPWPVKSLPLLPTAARPTAGPLSGTRVPRRPPITHAPRTPGLPTPAPVPAGRCPAPLNDVTPPGTTAPERRRTPSSDLDPVLRRTR